METDFMVSPHSPYENLKSVRKYDPLCNYMVSKSKMLGFYFSNIKLSTVQFILFLQRDVHVHLLFLRVSPL